MQVSKDTIEPREWLNDSSVGKWARENRAKSINGLVEANGKGSIEDLLSDIVCE